MKLRTLNLILGACLLGIVLDLPLIFFNMTLGASIMIVLITVLLFSGWSMWKLARADPSVLETLSKGEKELGLKDLPHRLIILLIAVLIIASLGYFGVFSSNPFIDVVLSSVAILLLVYYFFQKRKLRKKVTN